MCLSIRMFLPLLMKINPRCKGNTFFIPTRLFHVGFLFIKRHGVHMPYHIDC